MSRDRSKRLKYALDELEADGITLIKTLSPIWAELDKRNVMPSSSSTTLATPHHVDELPAPLSPVIDSPHETTTRTACDLIVGGRKR